MTDAIRVLGIDACRAGWVAVELRDGGSACARLHLDLSDLLSDVDGETTVGIDMPLGLLDTGWRAAETLATNRVGARRSSVFRVPPRPVWEQPGYRAANALCRRLTGAGFSVQ